MYVASGFITPLSQHLARPIVLSNPRRCLPCSRESRRAYLGTQRENRHSGIAKYLNARAAGLQYNLYLGERC
jgi:hypothetical protein